MQVSILLYCITSVKSLHRMDCEFLAILDKEDTLWLR